MSDRCAECPLASCSRLSRFGYEAGCKTFLEVRQGLPQSRSTENPPSPARKLRPLAESIRLLALIKTCPDFTPKEAGDPCGCMGRCKAGKGDMREGRTSYPNCVKCQDPESVD